MRTILFSLLLLPVIATAQSAALQSVFNEANTLYLEKKYDDAISRYQSIIKNGYENGEIYFNLGNSYYKTGKIHFAILYYEKAKKFLPADEDVQFNLQLANVKIKDKIDPIPELPFYQWADIILTMVPIPTMLMMIYFFFLTMLGGFAYFLFAKSFQPKRYALLVGTGSALLLSLGLANFLIQSYRDANTEYGIIITDVANIKSAPDRSGNDLFIIHAGLKVQMLDAVNSWKKIRLADGKIGWIPESDIAAI